MKNKASFVASGDFGEGVPISSFVYIPRREFLPEEIFKIGTRVLNISESCFTDLLIIGTVTSHIEPQTGVLGIIWDNFLNNQRGLPNAVYQEDVRFYFEDSIDLLILI